MLLRIFVAAVMVFIAHGANAVAPSKFYIVSVFFSDNGPTFYYRIVDVEQEGADSIIRYIRIAPTNIYCPRMIIQAKETRVPGETPAQLLGSSNLCALNSTGIRKALKDSNRRSSVFETVSFGIAAQCGDSSVLLELPPADIERLESSNPRLSLLWDLSHRITASAFGPDDMFQDRTEEYDLVLQRTGEKLLPQVMSGQYDKGLAAAFRGNVGKWKDPTFRSLLATYKGPISTSQAKAIYTPLLLNAAAYRFTSFVAPRYPPLAMQARIQGKVELQLSVDSATGEVRDASPISGHPLLTASAVEAAKHWRFEPDSRSSQTTSVTIEYSLECEGLR